MLYKGRIAVFRREMLASISKSKSTSARIA